MGSVTVLGGAASHQLYESRPHGGGQRGTGKQDVTALALSCRTAAMGPAREHRLVWGGRGSESRKHVLQDAPAGQRVVLEYLQ